MDKKIAGQPLWLWALGAVVVVGGYLYFKSHSSQQAQPSGQQGPPSKSTSSFKEWITQHQMPSTTHKTKGKGKGGGDD